MKREEILNRPCQNLKFERYSTNDLIYLSKGNKKLQPTDDVKFLIFNLPSVRCCPYRTKSCSKLCYSIKAEYQYGLSCIESRERNFMATLRSDFVQVMIKRITTYYKRACRNGKELFIRIHEAGDFYNQAYYDKWQQIAEHFATTNFRITFQAYTKSVVYVRPVRPDDLHITHSIWHDTNPEDIKLAKALKLQTYSAVTGEEFKTIPEANRCLCEDCARCAKCYRNELTKIIVKIH